ncbi:transmembrane amino acid transporter family protein [Striga asiatica]|uniref:Transmembrane amino acid transporter family protein n=1 Tax=Striga asiatica TaxID=4170 RepID=A0A5A7RJ19_STRAF|nr:transmembrane amino acid transporter family protein [Striga asiatica]
MAPEKTDSSEYFFEYDGNTEAAEDGIEEEEEDDDVMTVGSANDEVGGVSRTGSMASQQWPQSFRETTDFYSIAASPNFGTLFRSSVGSSAMINQNDLNDRMPLIADHKRGYREEHFERLKTPSLLSVSSSMPTGEFPLSHECSFVQTIFNGVNVMAGVGLLSTPYTVREGGWASLLVLVLFAFICCYTATLMKQCFESTDSILTFPDMGEAAFGKWGRILISIILYSELYTSCVEFIILEGDNLTRIFPGASLTVFGYHLDSVHLFAIIATLQAESLQQSCFLICVGLYGGAAIMGFLMFGQSTESQITLNLPPHTVGSKVALWTTVTVNKYALLMNPLARSMEELLPQRWSNSDWSFVLIRIALVISSLFVAFVIPFFGTVMSLIGSLFSVLMAVIMPALCFLRILGKSATSTQVVLSTIIVVLGAISAVLGTYNSFAELAKQY